MLMGNVWKSHPVSEGDLGTGICSNCHRLADAKNIDESYDDAFGTVYDFSIGSECCAEPLYDGNIFLERETVHIARKDHYRKRKTSEDELIIKKGGKYKYRIRKGYYIDDSGTHHGIFQMFKCPANRKMNEKKDWVKL